MRQSEIMNTTIEKLLTQETAITAKRKIALTALAKAIFNLKKTNGFAKANFICTHNSRRSQLSQIWFWYALQYFNIEHISAYSGGTESTAFNHRMVSALQRFGFNITKLEDSPNPKYVVRSGMANEREMILFSKKYSHYFNPSDNFVAVMVCSDVDEKCPFVSGASVRFPLTYLDPKAADDTPQEAKFYDDKVVEIGREILFMVQALKTMLQA